MCVKPGICNYGMYLCNLSTSDILFIAYFYRVEN